MAFIDDELDEVFHYNIDGTTCLVSWNESDIAPLTRKILVSFRFRYVTVINFKTKIYAETTSNRLFVLIIERAEKHSFS